MEMPTPDLGQLRDADPDIALILDTYARLDRVYREALEAIGISFQEEPQVKNSAEVSIEFTSVSTAYAKRNS